MSEIIKCGLCGKQATVHLTQIVNNKIHKVDLCESCAQSKGVTNPEAFSLAELLAQNNVTLEPKESQVQCPHCGHQTADFRKTGRLGCSECFEVFEPLLLPVLEDMHPATLHKGKVPSHSFRRQSSETEIKSLKDSLQRAIKEEAYEEAARLRDLIHEIESTVQNDQEVSHR